MGSLFQLWVLLDEEAYKLLSNFLTTKICYFDNKTFKQRKTKKQTHKLVSHIVSLS